mgnify:CR=1 FL=1
MNIHEYQAKQLLREYGVAVPRGGVAFTVEEAATQAQELGGPVYVVKSQIHAGGRGAGRFKNNPDGKGGVRIVKSFAAEKQQLGLLGHASARLRWITLKQVRIRAFFAPAMENLPRIGRALVLLYGGWLAINGQLTIGALVAINMYMIGLQAPSRTIGFL